MKNRSIEFKWAAIFVLVTLIWMVLERLVGLHAEYIDYHPVVTNFFAIPAVVMMVMALREKKKKFYDGNMSYVQGLISGTVMALIIAIFTPLTQWIISYLITPDYFTNVINRSVELGEYETIEDAQAFFNYQSYVIQGFIGTIFLGVITSAIAMIFIRSRK